MPKEIQAEVEKFKLSKEQINWSKQYEKAMKMGQLLNTKLSYQLSEAQKTRDMLRQIEGGVQSLIDKAPEKPVNEIEGQLGDAQGEVSLEERNLENLKLSFR